jgi:hypothetical protein
VYGEELFDRCVVPSFVLPPPHNMSRAVSGPRGGAVRRPARGVLAPGPSHHNSAAGGRGARPRAKLSRVVTREGSWPPPPPERETTLHHPLTLLRPTFPPPSLVPLPSPCSDANIFLEEGTRENPIPILSTENERIVGISLPDDSEIRWFTLRKGELIYDPDTCNFFALKQVTQDEVDEWVKRAEKVAFGGK